MASTNPSFIAPSRTNERAHSSILSITGMIGRPNLMAKAKSRSSWAGTAMIAPVP